jgi:hypothetical protein
MMAMVSCALHSNMKMVMQFDVVAGDGKEKKKICRSKKKEGERVTLRLGSLRHK